MKLPQETRNLCLAVRWELALLPTGHQPPLLSLLRGCEWARTLALWQWQAVCMLQDSRVPSEQEGEKAEGRFWCQPSLFSGIPFSPGGTCCRSLKGDSTLSCTGTSQVTWESPPHLASSPPPATGRTRPSPY